MTISLIVVRTQFLAKKYLVCMLEYSQGQHSALFNIVTTQARRHLLSIHLSLQLHSYKRAVSVMAIEDVHCGPYVRK